MIQHIFKVHKLGIIQLPIFGKSKKQHGTPKHMEVWFGSDDFPEFSTEDKEKDFSGFQTWKFSTEDKENEFFGFQLVGDLP